LKSHLPFSLIKAIMFRLQFRFLTIACILENAVAANLGSWGPTVQFPIVPVAVAIVPETGKLLTWSAYSAKTFEVGKSGITQTAIYDPATGTVTQVTVSNTNHDMFCPGISMDFSGRVIVTGGDTAAKTSIYNPSTNAWIAASDMQLPRGYQSSATISDGRVFTIGGSWSGGRFRKDGEIYNPTTNTWSNLTGCLVSPMLTKDHQGLFRQDNHAWLFAWKNGSVFQAGPSQAMNWYGTKGKGTVVAAGLRGTDTDAMTGISVMYDAVAGKIFSAGGSPSYQDSEATRNAQVITIAAPDTAASVLTINIMWRARAFANAVVLPTGEVFITGGQTYAVPFSDGNATMETEMWNPVTTKFIKMATNPTPRTYHSVALLMPDATVFGGGGGLCNTCATNHFDGQFYSPPYLFQADGVTPAVRPIISVVSGGGSKSNSVPVGGIIAVTLSLSPGSATTTFSLIRLGSATHSINTDQRRVPLTSKNVGTDGLKYTVQLPADPGVVLPGYWYLFVMVNGVPSKATIMLVTL
jgi:galactose oxidase